MSGDEAQEDRVERIRQALTAFANGMRSGSREEFLRTIRTIGEGDFEEFRSILADLAVERFALERAFREAYGIEAGAAVALNSGPSCTPAEGWAAEVTIEGDAARAEAAGGTVFTLVREADRWVVDWPADAMGEGGEENALLARWVEILRSFRERVGVEGEEGPALLGELAFSLVGAVSEAAGPDGRIKEGWDPGDAVLPE